MAQNFWIIKETENIKMRKLNNTELLSVNGGDKTLYEKVRDFVNNNLGDLVKGIRDGWNGK
jgi:hypothetical protein